MKKGVTILFIALGILSLAACEKQPAESVETESAMTEVQLMVGDIILADGSTVKAADFSEIDEENLPIAVIAGFQEDGTLLGVGVHRSDTPLQWEEDQADGDSEAARPAFRFVDAYAETYSLTGEFASGWYMPCIRELCDLYENRETVNVSLKKIHELDKGASMDGLETNWYWSSSESDTEEGYTWFVHFFNGYAGECPRNFTNVHVLVMRAF